MKFPRTSYEIIQERSQVSDPWPKVSSAVPAIIGALIVSTEPITVREIANLSGIVEATVQKDITFIPGALAAHAPGWVLEREGAKGTKGYKGYLYTLKHP